MKRSTKVSKPRIRLFALGGTIAMTRGPDGSVAPAVSGEALVDAVPGLAETARVEVETLANLGSANVTFDILLDLARRIAAAAEEGVDGVVVTQGTDTLAEASFLLALVLDLDIPVVCTGAMRHADMVSPDGPGNLLAAVSLACNRAAAAFGPVVVMAGEVHAARFVEKRHTASTAAFVSPGAGPVGEIVEDRLRILSRPAPLRTLPLERIGPVPMVPIIPAVFGDVAGSQLEAIPPAAAGLVIAAFGGGHLPEEMADKAAAIAARMPVVLASAVGAGPVFESTYGYKGAERDLISRGLIPAGMFSPPKARLLLSVMLAAGSASKDIEEALSV